jgi:hypothetical protein
VRDSSNPNNPTICLNYSLSHNGKRLRKRPEKIAGILQPFTECVTSTQTLNSAKSAHRIHLSISNSRNGVRARSFEVMFLKETKAWFLIATA